MPKITIIMPSLNVAQYIRACMESVLIQTMQDIEILAIDAGSDDGTVEILQEYAAMDRRVRLIHSDRKSYGYQLNQGIGLAQGKYIGIVETDDVIQPDMYEVLYQAAENRGSDYAKGVAEAFMETSIGEDIRHSIKVFSQERYDADGGIVVLAPEKHPELVLADFYLWSGIYKKEFLQGIRLNESAGAAYQDIGFMLQVHSKAKQAVYLDKLVYRYRIDNTASSCQNRNAFHYLVQEYEYVEQLLQGKAKMWYSACYCKLFRQTRERIFTMARSGVFWEEAIPDIYNLTAKMQKAFQDGALLKEYLEESERDEIKSLLKNPRQLYDIYEEVFQNKLNLLGDLFKKTEAQKAVIFGCGNWGRFCHILLDKRKHGTVVAYCDNDAAKHQSMVQGIEVLELLQAVGKYPNAQYVIAGKYHTGEMRKQLNAIGIEDGQITEYTLGVDETLYLAEIMEAVK